MSLNFPNAPTAGQVFTSEGRSFTWNGTVWLMNPLTFPWATNAQATAGTRADLTLSPAVSRVVTDAIPRAGGANPLDGTPTQMNGRVEDTNYQNTLGRPMVLHVWSTSSINIWIGAANPAATRLAQVTNTAAGWEAQLLALIPAGWWYRVTINSTASMGGWVEYR